MDIQQYPIQPYSVQFTRGVCIFLGTSNMAKQLQSITIRNNPPQSGCLRHPSLVEYISTQSLRMLYFTQFTPLAVVVSFLEHRILTNSYYSSRFRRSTGFTTNTPQGYWAGAPSPNNP
jgi:hypothetical protein